MKLTELPELTFASADVESIDAEVCAAVETQLGRKLARADPIRLFLRGVEAIILQQRYLIDQVAKQNLLAYALGDNLEHLGALVGLERKQPTAAICTMRLTLSAARAAATNIPAGIRFTAGDNVYFALDEDVTFLAGETTLEAGATCVRTGVVGNDYLEGEINQIVDPQAFLQSAENVTKTEGGAEMESDESLRERIHEAPEKFSNAGSSGAYRWHAMNASTAIIDVSVTSPSAGEVEVRPLLEGGKLPDTELLNAVDEAVNARSVRPLTDHVTVLAPDVAAYHINAWYWINRSDATRAVAIQAAADQAVAEYQEWQSACLGRDINPSELTHRLLSAGVKRVEMSNPTFATVAADAVASVTSVDLLYRGLEDD